MKIGEQRVDDLESVRGMDENEGASQAGDDAAVVRCGDAFEDAHGSCADGDNAAAVGFCAIDLVCGFFRNNKAFLVHGVVFEVVDFDGREGAGAHVQRQMAGFDPGGAQGIEEGRSEMQTGSGGGDGAG